MYITKRGLIFFLGVASPVAIFGAVQFIRRLKGYGDPNDPRNKVSEAFKQAWSNASVVR